MSRAADAFLVDGKVLRLRQTLEIKDRDGHVLATVRKKLIAMHETMEIEEDGALVATVRKALISPLHHRSTVDLADGSQLEVDRQHPGTRSSRSRAGGQVLARISRAWFRIRDTYGVEVARARTMSCSWPSPSRWTGSATTTTQATTSNPADQAVAPPRSDGAGPVLAPGAGRACRARRREQHAQRERVRGRAVHPQVPHPVLGVRPASAPSRGESTTARCTPRSSARTTACAGPAPPGEYRSTRTRRAPRDSPRPTCSR